MARKKKAPVPSVPMARIVHDTRDAGRDKFIPLVEVRRLYEEGKLVLLDMGPSYPHSYEEVRRTTNALRQDFGTEG